MDNSIFSAFLTALKVRHTAAYSDARFASMPFHTLFGLTTLLKEYHVPTRGIKLEDKAQITQLATPFIIPIDHTFIIVTAIADGKVSYQSVRADEQINLSDLLPRWDGTALLAAPGRDAGEPGYASHRLAQAMRRLTALALPPLLLLLLLWVIMLQGLEKNIWALLLILLNAGGAYLSFLLVQKTLGISSRHADRVCSVIQRGGCDVISRTQAASFLGIFHWSEVGLTFFSVNLLCILLFPAWIPAVALFCILSLPYTIWSISYQGLKAKAWCTMCVGVQLTLWLLFGCLLGGGWCAHIFPLRAGYLLLLGYYVAVMLVLNRFDNFLSSKLPDNE